MTANENLLRSMLKKDIYCTDGDLVVVFKGGERKIVFGNPLTLVINDIELPFKDYKKTWSVKCEKRGRKKKVSAPVEETTEQN